jgi:hypothetical protein
MGLVQVRKGFFWLGLGPGFVEQLHEAVIDHESDCDIKADL